MTLRSNILQEDDKTVSRSVELRETARRAATLRRLIEISATLRTGHRYERLVLPSDAVLYHALGNDIRVNAIKANRLL